MFVERRERRLVDRRQSHVGAGRRDDSRDSCGQPRGQLPRGHSGRQRSAVAVRAGWCAGSAAAPPGCGTARHSVSGTSGGAVSSATSGRPAGSVSAGYGTAASGSELQGALRRLAHRRAGYRKRAHRCARHLNWMCLAGVIDRGLGGGADPSRRGRRSGALPRRGKRRSCAFSRHSGGCRHYYRSAGSRCPIAATASTPTASTPTA